MSIRLKTKPLAIVSSIEELWDALATCEENVIFLEKLLNLQEARLRKLELLLLESTEEVETKRLD